MSQSTGCRIWLPILACVLATLMGCERPGVPTDHDAAGETAPSNRVDLGPGVRRNLGITFAKVEARAVARTLRVPGRFELMPTARREYRLPAAGTIELLVEQFQRVERGAPLFRFDSPRWREIQRELVEAETAVTLAEAAADSIAPFMHAHEQHHAELERAVDLWAARVASLEELRAAGAARGEDVAQARASLATVRADFAETLEKEVELAARARDAAANLEASRARRSILLEAASSFVGRTVAELVEVDGEQPRWQQITQVEVRALSPGVIEFVGGTSGALVESGVAVITTVQPEMVRFRAHALQSDLGRLAEGMTARVVPPLGGSLSDAAPVPGMLALPPTADGERRTVELIMTPRIGETLPPWARAGVSGFLEVTAEGGSRTELAIPLGCVARDGTESVIFRRDPSDPDTVIRMRADLGVDDGRWVEIRSGVAEGNEIVLDGVYQLMVATSGNVSRGGHFHPDGTFHEGDD